MRAQTLEDPCSLLFVFVCFCLFGVGWRGGGPLLHILGSISPFTPTSSPPSGTFMFRSPDSCRVKGVGWSVKSGHIWNKRLCATSQNVFRIYGYSNQTRIFLQIFNHCVVFSLMLWSNGLQPKNPYEKNPYGCMPSANSWSSRVESATKMQHVCESERLLMV